MAAYKNPTSRFNSDACTNKQDAKFDFNLQYLILQMGTNGLNSDNTADGRTLNVLISVHLHKFQKKDT